MLSPFTSLTFWWQLWQGYGAVRELENVATDSGDKPTHECFIKDCGQLAPGASTAPPLQVSHVAVQCILFTTTALVPMIIVLV